MRFKTREQLHNNNNKKVMLCSDARQIRSIADINMSKHYSLTRIIILRVYLSIMLLTSEIYKLAAQPQGFDIQQLPAEWGGNSDGITHWTLNAKRLCSRCMCKSVLGFKLTLTPMGVFEWGFRMTGH